MDIRLKTKILSAILLAVAGVAASAREGVSLEYEASVLANWSTGDLAPYMLGSWRYGRVTGASGIWQDGRLEKRMSLDTRFSWGAGVEYIAGYGTAAPYALYDEATNSWGERHNRQAPLRLHQLYGEVKYRGVYLLAGMKERHSGIVDDALSSGDLTRSNNARPIPGVAAGFVDFQDIPLTNGWVQIDGEIMYGRLFDGSLREKTFNYYTGVFTDKMCYTYKRCYFRTKPSQPLSVTVGMQTGAFFGGTTQKYRKGKFIETIERGFQIRDLWDMFFPTEGGEDYYKGGSLGSWDFKARYAFANGSELTAYFEWPWEDGSGIGRMNGFDGVWGLQYNFAKSGPVNKVVVEYLDFTNQSGPIHWSPDDSPGTTITDKATGADDYYNNAYYGPYTNYGMSIGTPFLISPLYNRNGYPQYLHTRARGFHAAVSGNVTPQWEYTAKVSYQRAGGTGWTPARRISDTSALVSARWTPQGRLSGLSLTAEAAFDAGKLRGNNFGAMVGVSYKGNFTFGKK